MKSLKDRIKASFDRRDSGGASRPNFSGLNLNGLNPKPEFMKVEAGFKYAINVIPYRVSASHPLVKRGELNVGDYDYGLEYYTHRGVGPDNSVVVCPKKTFGKNCPICEKQRELYAQNAEQSEIQKLSASRRMLYNVEEVLEDGEITAPKLFSVSHFLFEKPLVEEFNSISGEEEDALCDFTDTSKDGATIKFRVTEIARGAIKFLEFGGFRFAKRAAAVSKEVIEKALSLDTLLEIKTYQEIKTLFEGSREEDDDEEVPVKKAQIQRRDNEEEWEPPVKKAQAPQRDNDEEWEPPVKVEKKPQSSNPTKVEVAGKCPFNHPWGNFANEDQCLIECPPDVSNLCQKATAKKKAPIEDVPF